MLPLFIAILLVLAGCSGKNSGAASATAQHAAAADTAGAGPGTEAEASSLESPAAMEQEPEQAAPFEKTLRAGKVSFTLSCPNKEAEKNILCATPQGLEVRNEQLCLEAAGRVYEAFQADLNQDGFIEVYALSAGPKPESRGQIYGFSSYRDRSHGPITIREPEAGVMEGYQGRDTFYLAEGSIKRAFPLFGSDKQPTGRQRIISYALEKGETSFILEPGGSETGPADR